MNKGWKFLKKLTSINQNTVKNTINDQELPACAKNLTITTPRTSCITFTFYPKFTNKPNNPGRSIVSACSCPTELISSYLDKIMAPIVKTLPSYIKDSQNAQIFRDFSFLGQDKLLFSLALWTSYLFILSFIMPKVFWPSNIFLINAPSSETLLRLAELVLTYTQLFFIRGQLFKTNPWRSHGYQNGTQLC